MSSNERSALLPKAPRTPADYTTKQRWGLLIAISWLPFLSAMDMTIAASLVAPIASEFAKSENSGWLGSAYLLSVCVATPVYGRLVDIIGRRRSVLLAAFFFGLGTAGCSVAPSMTALIAARFVAGLGGGGLQVTSNIIASDLFSTRERGLVQGVINIIYGCGAGIGAPFGGLFSDTIGWRAAFAVQLPLIAAVSLMAQLLVRYELPGKSEHQKKSWVKRIDWAGGFTLLIWVGALLMAMSLKTNQLYPWSSPLVIGLLAISIIFFGLFILVERRFDEPIMPTRLVTQRSIFCLSIGNFVLSWTFFSLIYNLPQLFEIVFNQSSGQAGAHLTPVAAMLSAGSLSAGIIMRRTGRYKNLRVFADCLPIFSFVSLALLTRKWPVWTHWIAPLPEVAGIAISVTANLIGLIATVEKADVPVITGMSYLFRFIGQVVGVAASASVLQARLSDELAQHFPGSDDLIDKIRHTASIIKTLPSEQREPARDAYLAALHSVFGFNGAVSLIALAASFFITEKSLSHELATSDAPREANGDA